MTSTSLPGGATKSGRERRRFPRYDVEVKAILRKKGGDVHLLTVDVSRHGAFLRTETPAPVRQLVQVRFRLPDGEIDAMCMVARWLGADTPRGPGMGVDFFALSKDAKNLWERFIGDLRARDNAVGFEAMSTGSLPPARTNAVSAAAQGVALPSSLGVPSVASVVQPDVVGANGVPTWMAPNSVTGEVKVRHGGGMTSSTLPVTTPPMNAVPLPGQPLITSAGGNAGSLPPSALAAPTWPPQAATSAPSVPPLPLAPSLTHDVQMQLAQVASQARPPPPPDDDIPVVTGNADGHVVILRLPDRDQLRGFVANEVERGGMFLKTPLIKEVGEKVDVLLVHPESDEEFRLDGTVVRRVITGPVENRGLGIFFRALSKQQTEQLNEFIESGIEVVELGTPISQRQIDLEAAVAREPDSAEALEALGSFLLDEEGDLGGALTALTRALVLGPSQLSIHASLARAYRRIGDPVKVRAHERVAEALLMFQERMKVRMGVGEE